MIYTSSIFGSVDNPDTYICSASAQRLSLRLWGSWGGAVVSVLVCTQGAAFEIDSSKFGVFSGLWSL